MAGPRATIGRASALLALLAAIAAGAAPVPGHDCRDATVTFGGGSPYPVIADAELSNPTWYRRFVRDPAKVPDPRYVRAQTAGQEVFADFFEGRRSGSLGETIQAQHTTVLAHRYEVRDGGLSALKDQTPGVFRTSGGVPEVGQRADLDAATGAGLRLTWRSESDPVYGNHRAAEWRTPLDGIPEVFQPWNQVLEGEFRPNPLPHALETRGFELVHEHPALLPTAYVHGTSPLRSGGRDAWLPRLPPPTGPQGAEQLAARRKAYLAASERFSADCREAYLARMGTLLTQIRERVGQDTPLTPEQRREAAGWVADYYQVAINAQFFDGVNNSLLMGQANYMLDRLGYRPIPHGRLDYLAYFTPSAGFRELFVRAVEAGQRP